MRAHPIGMQAEPLGQLVGGGRAADFAEEREQSPPGRLGEHVVPVPVWEVNGGQLFSHLVGRSARMSRSSWNFATAIL